LHIAAFPFPSRSPAILFGQYVVKKRTLSVNEQFTIASVVETDLHLAIHYSYSVSVNGAVVSAGINEGTLIVLLASK
jgi:hypothetical protein